MTAGFKVTGLSTVDMSVEDLDISGLGARDWETVDTCSEDLDTLGLEPCVED